MHAASIWPHMGFTCRKASRENKDAQPATLGKDLLMGKGTELCVLVSAGASLVWEEQEPREDAVRFTSAHHAIVIIHLQPDLIPSLQMEEDSSRGNLDAVGLVVTEAGLLDLVLE